MAAATALALGLSGCTSGELTSEPSPTPVEGSSSAPATPTPTAEPVDAPVDTSNPDITTYFDKRFTGGDLRLGRVRERQATYTSRNVTFKSEGLTISGVLNVPRGRGPFPAVVLVHGYIDPAVYEQGQGMTRERGYLSDKGFIALHVDLRGHAASDDDPRLDRGFRLGYAADAINAVHALRATTDVPVDDDRMALAGRSMGGGVVLQALEMSPGLVGAGVVFSGVSSLEADQWAQYGDGGSGFWSDTERRWGTPDENPEPYLRASTRPRREAGRRGGHPALVRGGRPRLRPPVPGGHVENRPLPPARARLTSGLIILGSRGAPELPASHRSLSLSKRRRGECIARPTPIAELVEAPRRSPRATLFPPVTGLTPPRFCPPDTPC